MKIPTPEELRAAAFVGAGDMKSLTDALTEWEVAFHEAGHVVVEVVTGSRPDGVYLNDDKDTTGGEHAGRTLTRSFAAIGVETEDQASKTWIERELRRCAAVTAAGDIACDIARGFPVDIDDAVSALTYEAEEADDSTDGRRLRALVEGMTTGAAEVWLEEAIAWAEGLLREHWTDVERVAAALVERRRLDREDLWDLLDHEHAGPSRGAVVGLDP